MKHPVSAQDVYAQALWPRGKPGEYLLRSRWHWHYAAAGSSASEVGGRYPAMPCACYLYVESVDSAMEWARARPSINPD